MKRPPERLFAILKDNGFTPFQIKVYRTVSRIPWGQTRSYKWVAEKLGRPGAPRAVGQALKKNPLFFIIPCHRIIRGNGSPGGFSKGSKAKKRLLDLENLAIIK